MTRVRRYYASVSSEGYLGISEVLGDLSSKQFMSGVIEVHAPLRKTI